MTLLLMVFLQPAHARTPGCLTPSILSHFNLIVFVFVVVVVDDDVITIPSLSVLLCYVRLDFNVAH